jgi:hypothetical protein
VKQAWHQLDVGDCRPSLGKVGLRFTGYSRYQPRVHSTGFDLGFALFDVALFVAVLVWQLRIRERYIRYIQDANSSET